MKLLTEINLFVKAKPLSRPRKGKYGNVYQCKKNQKDFLDALHHWAITNNIKEITNPVYIFYDINFKLPKTVQCLEPITKNLGDIDNLAKSINDGLVIEKILADDSLIVGTSEFKTYNDEDYVSIAIFDVKTKKLIKKLLHEKLEVGC